MLFVSDSRLPFGININRTLFKYANLKSFQNFLKN